MVNWSFEAQEERTTGYELIPVGKYRIRIASIDERKTKSGMDAINITFDVSGKNQKIFYWLNFDMNHAQITNQKLQSIYDSFGIPRGELNFNNWIGRVGACQVKHTHDPQYGDKAEVHYFITPQQATNLPAWVEGETGNSSVNSVGSMPAIDSDIQF